MNIVITDADTVTGGDIDLSVFEKYGSLTVYPLTDPETLDKRIENADIVLCNKTVITAENMKKAKNLKYIGLFATGYNNIDTDFAKKNNIAVCNAPDYSTEAVAQHTFAFILQLTDRVGEYNSLVLKEDWIRSSTFSYFPLPTMELFNKTLGIIGYGAIGRRVAEIAKAFNMNVLVCNRSKISDSTVSQVGFDELLEKSDIVSLHCPLNKQSEGLMNKDAFAKMKKGALFINTARGPIVDEKALRDALENGHLGGAGIDVLKYEPMRADCPLYKAKNCFITPHISWAGYETRLRLMRIVEDNIKVFLKGETKNNVV